MELLKKHEDEWKMKMSPVRAQPEQQLESRPSRELETVPETDPSETAVAGRTPEMVRELQLKRAVEAGA